MADEPSYDDLLAMLEKLAPSSGPDTVAGETGGVECACCGALFDDWTSKAIHRPDCAWVEARATIAKATGQ